MAAARLEGPSYLPTRAQGLLPWCRRYVAKLSTRDSIPLEDLWDEAIAALLRADIHFSTAAGTRFSTYACNSVIRGCWRYVARSTSQRRRGLGHQMAIEEADLHAPSVEDELLALEAMRTHKPATTLHIVHASARVK